VREAVSVGEFHDLVAERILETGWVGDGVEYGEAKQASVVVEGSAFGVSDLGNLLGDVPGLSRLVVVQIWTAEDRQPQSL